MSRTESRPIRPAGPAARRLTLATFAALALAPLSFARAESTPSPGSTDVARADEHASAETPKQSKERGAAAGDSAERQPNLKPRLELWIPSVRRLFTDLERSHAGAFVDPLRRMLIEAGESSAEGVGTGGVIALAHELMKWPDSSIAAATYAPDLESRPRWVLRLDWPLDALHERVAALLELDAAERMLEGVKLRARNDGGFELALPGGPLAYLLAANDNRSYIASHAELDIPSGLLGGILNDGRSEPTSLVTARLNLAQTETDSGATWLSSFSAVTTIDYVANVGDDGEWRESVYVYWPGVSGMGAKALFNRVDQTFYVPHAAFGAAVMSVPLAKGMLDGMAGLGPQVMMDAPGQMEVVSEPTPGPIARHAESDVCFMLLPGTGFLPVPDVVVQIRTRRPKALADALRDETKRINKLYLEREQPEPWHESAVRDRPVFWSDPTGPTRGMMMPFVMRPVLFVAKEQDAKDRERSFLVLGLTTTGPEDLVHRWLNFPRTKDFRHLPSKNKTNGQVWVNWRALYGWVSPYLNLTLSSAGIDAILPATDDIKDKLTDGFITGKLKYSRMTASHRGPIPAGLLVIPAMISKSFAADRGGGSDLARERLARQRLRLLHHHCKLFRKDIGRWPAEVGELDGYVDFAGHPELLDLRVSSSKAWSEWVSGVFEPEKKEEADDDGPARIKTDLYVIDWGRDRWTLGYKLGTFEHLERLYIDQDGEIHGIESKEPRPEPEAKAEPSSDESAENENDPDETNHDENGKE